MKKILVPDIGDFKDVPVIEVLVAVGDTVKKDQSLISVESDKATMEVPSSAPGVVRAILVKLGDKVNTGDAIVEVEDTAVTAPSAVDASADKTEPAPGGPALATSSPAVVTAPVPTTAEVPPRVASDAGYLSGTLEHTLVKINASPSVRKLARELGAELDKVVGTGNAGRVTHEDVKRFIRSALAARPVKSAAPVAVGKGIDLLPWPNVDFSKYGSIERQALSRIKKISGANLHRNWVLIPHVTNHDEADVTDLEAFRVAHNARPVSRSEEGAKLTLLAFVIKACVDALRRFPTFNASLDGEELVLKKYFHIGFAADTPNGLVVPVVRDADQKGIVEIASECSRLAALAREGKLSPAEMQGGCFSVSSLGGIGGTNFTPIINAPEVAILGVCKTVMKPVWNGSEFTPRLMMPLSLSWDHRVIDGALAARFLTHLTTTLADMRRTLL